MGTGGKRRSALLEYQPEDEAIDGSIPFEIDKLSHIVAAVSEPHNEGSLLRDPDKPVGGFTAIPDTVKFVAPPGLLRPVNSMVLPELAGIFPSGGKTGR